MTRPCKRVIKVLGSASGWETAPHAHRPDQREPDFGVTSVNFAFSEPLDTGCPPG
jgi:hypothetical protein